MPTITLTVDYGLLKQAHKDGRPLEVSLQQWLAEYARRGQAASRVRRFLEAMPVVRSGEHFTREQRTQRRCSGASSETA